MGSNRGTCGKADRRSNGRRLSRAVGSASRLVDAADVAATLLGALPGAEGGFEAGAAASPVIVAMAAIREDHQRGCIQ